MRDAAKAADLEDMALEIFIQALKMRHGYDFSGYARASLKRRVAELARAQALPNIGALVPRVLYDEAFLPTVVSHLSVPVSALFRDPEIFLELRRHVLPVLASWPRVNIWQAGCAAGEEVYSLAILLAECGLARRSQIYATDFNDHALERAAEGIFSADQLHDYEANYVASGGTGRLADYYHERYDLVRIRRELFERVVFAHHNLVTDGVFAESHLILCRNVLIYFDKPLKERVLTLFADSLVRGGFLVLRNKESLRFSAAADRFEVVDERARIYRLKHV